MKKLMITLLAIVFLSPALVAQESITSAFYDFSYLYIFGFFPYGSATLDYYPLLPWFGVVLIGIFSGNMLYFNYKRRFNIIDLSKSKIIQGFEYLGKRSLIIYVIHQPIIILILYLVLRIS